MASIRNFKKQVRYTCGDLAAETLVASHFVDGFDRAQAHALINRIAILQADTLSKCTISYDKVRRDFANDAEYRKARGQYFSAAFAALRNKFADEVQAIVKDMNAALPAEAKAANKA